MTLTTVFEALYRGERHVGFGTPGQAEQLTLHPVAAGALAAAFVAGADSAESLLAALGPSAGIPVAADDPELRLLPPLLPGDPGKALLSGFMGTHRKKWDGRTAPEDAAFEPPKWFFKGFGDWARLPGETLTVPASAIALIEEPEVVLVYVNDAEGRPHYAGYTFGNDLCDIGLHRKDPGYNPYCKLCDTGLLPQLFLGEPPRTVSGRTVIERDGAVAWEGVFECGADALYFRVPDMVRNLFSYPALRRPGLVNYVLLGADEASFHDGFRIADGDRITIDVKSHGVTLEHPVAFVTPPPLDAAP